MSANLEELREKLTNPDSLLTDPASWDDYRHDATEASGEPLAVLIAESEADVLAAVRFCFEHSIPIVARGAGTGLSGGSVPTPGTLVLSTERLDEMTIYPNDKIAVCGPGVITKDLMDAAAKLELAFPPDPASYKESTLGGNVAENAGGLRCKRFGVTKDYVIGIKGVTSSGELLLTGDYAEGRGFLIADILLASEGTLAVITEIRVRLIEAVAPGTTILVTFDLPRQAAQTVADITGAGIIPTVMEYLDGDAAECSNRYEKSDSLIHKVGAILLIETNAESKLDQVPMIELFCHNNNCSLLQIEPDPLKADKLWAVRRNLSKAVKEIAAYRISEDVAVNNSKFPELVQFVADMNSRSPLRINAFGHAGDGNLHVNFLSMNNSDEDKKLMEVEIKKLLAKAIELGGSITGEHGVGLAKREYLPLEFDRPTLTYMRNFKKLFDPGNLLNPGKIFI